MPADPVSAHLSVGIIGAGPGGLALGILLSRAGFNDFTIFDREDDVGGDTAEGEAVTALDRRRR
jgi:cyclohexanone monooxygenase